MAAYDSAFAADIRPRCKKTGKIQFNTQADADSKIERIRVKPNYRGELHSYHCPHCGFYHLGHPWRNELHRQEIMIFKAVDRLFERLVNDGD